jgi:hypothetical protein
VYAGLSFQLLPNLGRPLEYGQRLLDVAAQAMRDDPDAPLALVEEMQQQVAAQAAAGPLGGGAAAQRLIHTAEVRAERRVRLDFPMPNEFDLGAVEAREMESRLKELRPPHLYDTLVDVQRARRRGAIVPSPELAARMAEANAYLAEAQTRRRACMGRFANLCQLAAHFKGDAHHARVVPGQDCPQTAGV